MEVGNKRKRRETMDHYERKKYLAFVSGGYFEVLGPLNKYYDASSFSGRMNFEYERHKNRFRYAAEKLYEKVKRDGTGILVVKDNDIEEALRIVGDDFPGINILSESETDDLYPGLIPTIFENVGRRQKEFRIRRQLILKSDMSPGEKVFELRKNFRDRINNILFGND